MSRRALPIPALVLDGDGRAALAAVRTLGRHGVRVTVAASTTRSLAGASRHAHRRLVLPDPMADPDRLAAALAGLAAREPGAVWFPMTDASLAVVDTARAELGAVRLPIPDSGALALAWDKARLIEVAEAAGVATPLTWMPASGDEVRALAPDLPYPVVLKPRRSRWRGPGGFVEGQVSYAHTPAALVAAWEELDARIPAPLIQERVPGFGLGIFLLADRGRVLARFAHRRLREKPPSGGVSVLRESIAVPPELAAPADRLLAALGWHGVCMIEFKVDARDERPRLMEINPRFWGSLELAIAAGVDFPWLLYRLAIGEAPERVTSHRLGVRSRWELGDLDHLLIRLRARQARDLPAGAPSRLATLLAFLNPWAGRPEVFRLGDPGPAWHELRSYVRNLRGGGAGAPPTTAPRIGEARARAGDAADPPAGGTFPRRRRRLRGALHLHSRYSHDGCESLTQLADHFRHRGLDFICLADHPDGLAPADLERLGAEARAASGPHFLVIPGLEFSCRHGLHLLGLGVLAPTAADDPLLVADHIRRAGGLAVLAHPLAASAEPPDELAARLDGLEVWNAAHDGGEAPRRPALKLWRAWRARNSLLRGYATLGLHVLDGSAAAAPPEVWVEVEAMELSPPAVLAALRRGPLRLCSRHLTLDGGAPPATPRRSPRLLAWLVPGRRASGRSRP